MQDKNGEAQQEVLSQQEYQMCCDYFSLTEQELFDDHVLWEQVIHRWGEMRSLALGYCEMAEINEALCQEFLPCDKDLSVI
ncbi:hypothetical protein LFYK43_07840 [Ligilactobacillus salitolerans]|uniref:Uncharacterized protein n=1 Tax=Ligilactobacillus salitolerans TaxID=1808352 RepID=A0A401IS50_9LACO|nr:hypothetical protein [Ligilactobacillus salitolerans]GBG94325.1 hypothetical protein LFYK43_07840 [Ligilactobacillus salitolerans]